MGGASSLWNMASGYASQMFVEEDLERRQGEISELMINNNNIRKYYSSLVPGKVQHKLFWARYFYKVHLIEKQEAKRQVLKKRAEQTKVDSDTEINWDEDDDDLDNVQEI